MFEKLKAKAEKYDFLKSDIQIMTTLSNLKEKYGNHDLDYIFDILQTDAINKVISYET